MRSLLLLAISLSSASIPAFSAPKSSERQDRLVDIVAYESQDRAERSLILRIEKLGGTKAAPDFSVRLADLMKEKVDVGFRLQGHYAKYKAKYKKDLLEWLKVSRSVLPYITQAEGADRMQFYIGSALDEMLDKKNALTEFLVLLTTYKQSEFRNPSIMAATMIQFNNGDHIGVLKWIDEVAEADGSPYQVHALYRRAWSQFNVREFRLAINSLHKILKVPSNMLTELACRDQASFAGEAIERRAESLTVKESLEMMKDSCTSIEHLQKSQVWLVKILRSRKMVPEMEQWLDWSRSRGSKIAWLDGAEVVSEYYFNNRNWKAWLALQGRAGEELKDERSATYVRHLEGRLQELRDAILKNKQATDVGALVDVYHKGNLIWIPMLTESKLQARAWWNIGELYSALAKWSQATSAYAQSESLESSVDTTYRKISARSQELIKDLGRPELKARKYIAKAEAEQRVKDLESWLDGISKSDRNADWLKFWYVAREYKVARGVSQDVIQEIEDRLKEDQSDLSAKDRDRWMSFCVETHVLNKEWERVVELKPLFKETDGKLNKVALQSEVKIIAEAKLKNDPEWIERGRALVEAHRESPEVKALRMWLIEDDLKAGKEDYVRQALGQIESQYGSESLGVNEWELRLHLDQKSGNRAESMRALEALAQKDPKKYLEGFRSLVYAFQYPLKKCFADICESVKKWSENSSDKKLLKSSYSQFHKRPKEFRQWLKDWKKLPPLIQMARFIDRQPIIDEWLVQMRRDVKKYVPVKRLTEKALLRRIEWIWEIERSTKGLFELPWTQGRAAALLAVADIYKDFEDEVSVAQPSSDTPAELPTLRKQLNAKREAMLSAQKGLVQELIKQTEKNRVWASKLPSDKRRALESKKISTPNDLAQLIIEAQELGAKEFFAEAWISTKKNRNLAGGRSGQ
jgi:hypothetical protein